MKVFEKGDKVGKETTLRKPFTQWFDKAGHFVVLPFQQILASNVPLLGRLDPTRAAVENKKKKTLVDDDKSLDQKWVDLLAESSGVSIEDLQPSPSTSGKKKRSKKS